MSKVRSAYPLILSLFMSVLLSSSTNPAESNLLESHIRTALEIGELSPGLETTIRAWANRYILTERDQTLLQILQDAIESGCVRRVG